ncbi:MAG: hypothetical protein K8T26_15565 [Lentisphaerae bacterium]|nr:hypothetical protein [Lentisphaerota bacterium]
MNIRAVAAAILLTGTSLAVARQDFTYYSVILQRKPFGEPAAAAVAAPVAAQVAPADSFVKNLRLCAITENAAGIRVGLIDLASKPPRSYFLYVGDTEDSIELVKADYTTERALLRKGSEEYWLSMDATGGGGGGASASPGSEVTTIAAAGSPASRRTSYAERLRKRREAEEARLRELEAQPKLTPEELEKTLQQFQLDVIRRGEPPLPIPLTPEMDEQLVAEGVLPPQE